MHEAGREEQLPGRKAGHKRKKLERDQRSQHGELEGWLQESVIYDKTQSVRPARRSKQAKLDREKTTSSFVPWLRHELHGRHRRGSTADIASHISLPLT